MTTPRLLVFAPSAYPLGGLATWLDGIMPELEARGWTVDLALPEGRTFELEAYLRRHPWRRVRRLRNPSGTDYGRRRAICSVLEATPFDVALGVNFPDLYAVAGERTSAGQAPVRVVCSLHGFVGGLFKDLERFRHVLTAVVTTNRLAAAAAKEVSGVADERVFHAPYGTHLEDLDAPVVTPARFPLELVYAGRLDLEQKRVLDLPPILLALDGAGVAWNLRVAGSGPAEPDLRAALGFDSRVEFLGDISSERVRREVFVPGRVLVLPSSWETGPIVAWEAMERGVAVVASEYLGCAAEGLLRSGENCLLFPVGDHGRAAEHLRSLAQRPDLGGRLTLAGRRLVEGYCSLVTSGQAWDRALREALELPIAQGQAQPWELPVAGRLERWLGARLATTARELFRLPAYAGGPGDEWPHSFGGGLLWPQLASELAELEKRLVSSSVSEGAPP